MLYVKYITFYSVLYLCWDLSIDRALFTSFSCSDFFVQLKVHINGVGFPLLTVSHLIFLKGEQVASGFFMKGGEAKARVIRFYHLGLYLKW
jgi:hypothetical protein